MPIVVKSLKNIEMKNNFTLLDMLRKLKEQKCSTFSISSLPTQ